LNGLKEMTYKNEIRVIGIDDSPFDKFKKDKVLVIGVVMRGGKWIDGVLSTKVNTDDDDSTKKIIDMINNCKFKPQLQCIFLDGIAVAGLNIIDIKRLHKKTKIPVMVVIRKQPDIKKMKDVLINLKKNSKIKLLDRAGKIMQIGKIYVQLAGIDKEEASEVLKVVCTRSLLPEPVRAAHLIAAGVVTGESKGRA
jgi:hypothetical protein